MSARKADRGSGESRLTCLFHADDCGMTQGITRAILDALQAGRLQSTSIMAGGARAAEAMTALAALPGAFVGVHLNLLEGKACAASGALPDITNEQGFFHLSLPDLWRLLTLSGRKKREAVREQVFTEFCAQTDQVRRHMHMTDIRLDGHLHVHCLPALLPVMREMLRTYPVSYLRIPFEGRYLPGSAGSAGLLPALLRRELLALWSAPLKKAAEELRIPTAAHFIGAYGSGAMTLEALRRGLAHAARTAGRNTSRAEAGPAPLVEIMLHPGYTRKPDRNSPQDCIPAQKCEEDPQTARWYAASHYTKAHNAQEREAEIRLLLSPEFAALRSLYS